MLSQQIKDSSTLLDSIDAMRNWRAVVLLLITLVAAGLVMGLGTLLSGISYAFVALFALAAYAVVFYGANAVGMMLMDEAQGLPSRPIVDAVAHSLASSHRLLLVYAWLGALYLAGLIVLVVVLLLCKIPLLGPLLYTAVFPIAVVLSGVALFALPTVVFPLSAPSVWAGATARECVSQLIAIARRRLMMVLVLMLAVALIATMVGLLIGAILFAGVAVTAGVSAPILGNLDSMALGGMGSFGMGSAGAHATAAGFGGGVLFAAAFTLPGLVYLRGASTVYLRALDGLDLASEQADVDAHLDYARHKARAMQEQAQAKAQQVADRARAAAAGAAATAAAPAAAPADVVQAPQADAGPAPLQCPQCANAVAPTDTFCAACGTYLR
ncbi:zinc ribbon domain-containing protein [Pseudorhodoferax sp. Leaf267]|uniref:zinc ribbon domain-containing protein n=1 Tax=Pseudorhodoferax sp. Leaf267 TaxID=1736316 RepID=UPI0006F87402|nr:zinc ribbon domain-containing protein [Pseudorhodoferax sp. Leaf267]KQP22541.1 hypothetical protein ASF43_01035 [Pseudorhodoferax sp. Leaf267]